jgi:DNA-binding Lrp family transcriptional regulator
VLGDLEEGNLEALVLVNVEVGVLWQVLEAVLKVDGVKTVYGVTGQFDAVVLIQFTDLDDMGKIIERIHHVKGVLRTQTLLTVPPPVRMNSVMPNLPEEEKIGPSGYPDS